MNSYNFQKGMVNKMSDRLSGIRQEILDGISQLSSSRAVYEFKKKFMDSKTGKIGQLMKEMKTIAPEERANFGKGVNELKEWANKRFDELDEKMRARELQRRYESEKIDVTMPAKAVETGKIGRAHV